MRDGKTNNVSANVTARRPQCSSREARAASNSDRLVEVDAWAGTPGYQNWGLLLKFIDRAGNRQIVRLPGSKIRNRARLLDFLDEYGVPVPPDPTELVRYIQEAQPKRFVRLVARPGWHANQFLLGDKTVGQGKERLRLDGTGSERATPVNR